MSRKPVTLPRRAFALFAVEGRIEVRTVTMTGLFEPLNAACVTEPMTGRVHYLDLSRVASETTLETKRQAFAQKISAHAAETSGTEKMPVMTSPKACAA